MGSKRSSKNLSKARSSPPPADPPLDGNHQNPKDSSLVTPSKSRKKQKVLASISNDANVLSLSPSSHRETNSQNSNRKGKAAEVSKEISPRSGAASRSGSLRWGEAEILKLLKSIIAIQAKSGFLLTSANISVLMKEIKDWAPGQLSKKNFDRKLRHLQAKFHKGPKPGPGSSEFDRSFHELASKVWGPESSKAKGNATVGVKELGMVEKMGTVTGNRNASKKPKGENKKVDDENEDEDVMEEEESDSEHDDDTDEKAEKNIVLENGEEHEKDELLLDGDNDLLDGKAAGHSYKYLTLALEEYWTESKLNMDTLYAALPKVNPVQARRLDESFREVFLGMLELKMEKNKISNEIIRASLGC